MRRRRRRERGSVFAQADRDGPIEMRTQPCDVGARIPCRGAAHCTTSLLETAPMRSRPCTCPEAEIDIWTAMSITSP